MLAAIIFPSRFLSPLRLSGERRILSRLQRRRGSVGTAAPVNLQTGALPVAVAVAQTGPQRSKPQKSTKESSQKGFADLVQRQDLITAMSQTGFSAPTEIQEKGIPAILKGQDVVLASHTGSGKTLAYLLPLVQQLKNQEEHGGIESRMKRPRALVLGPTRELTDQILHVSKSLSHHVKFRSAVLNAGGRRKTQKEHLAMPQDIVIATPSRLNDHIKDHNMFFGDIRFLVLDEADTMFDAGFGPEVSRIVEILSNKPINCQFILIGATMGKDIKKMIKKTFTNIAMIQTSSLHKGVPGSQHRFITNSAGQDKITQLQETLKSDLRKSKKVMVFCNTMDSCRAVEHTLAELGIQTLCYHGDMPIEQRKDAMHKFSSQTTDGNGGGRVLVCTDLAARGLDISGRVDHVINFDFPKTPIDYIHRSGRTARAGAPGLVTSLLRGRDRTLANRIEWAINHNLPLDELSMYKEDTPPSMRKQQPVEKVPRRGQSVMKGLRGAARLEALKVQSRKAAAEKRAARQSAKRKSQSRKRKAMSGMKMK